MEEPIRIAQILNRMDSGGVEAVVMNYYRFIDRTKVQFDFYFEDQSVFPQREELERLGAGIYTLPSYKRTWAYDAALGSALREHRYPIVHVQMSTLSCLPLFVAWRSGIPVRICHTHTTATWSEGPKTVLKYLLRPLCRLLSTDWFACGKAAGKWMYGEAAYARNRIQIMPNGIDLSKFIYDPQARSAVRAEYGIPESAFVVGHIGRFVYQKNHAFLLKIFEQVLAAHPDAYLLLFGEGNLQERIREQAAGMGIAEHVIFGGVRKDVARCYSAMDVFCLPSFYEGVPVVAIEAQANGLPCLCSDTVSTEAATDRLFCQMALEEGAGAWGQRLFEVARERLTDPVIRPEMEKWDIRVCAAWMQEWYENRYRLQLLKNSRKAKKN